MHAYSIIDLLTNVEGLMATGCLGSLLGASLEESQISSFYKIASAGPLGSGQGPA